VHVLEDGDRRLDSQLVEERGEQGRALRIGHGLVGAEAVQSSDDVVDRPEWAWREERLTTSPENPDLVLVARGEGTDERRLPDARLATDDDDSAGAEASTLEVRVELRAGVASLEEGVIRQDGCHRRILRAR
jgi:hypothetical protein